MLDNGSLKQRNTQLRRLTKSLKLKEFIRTLNKVIGTVRTAGERGF